MQVASPVSRAGKRTLKLVYGTYWKSKIWEATQEAAPCRTEVSAVIQKCVVVLSSPSYFVQQETDYWNICCYEKILSSALGAL